MKAKVIRRFKDKNSKKVLNIGEIIEISKERCEELITSPLGVFVEEVDEDDNGGEGKGVDGEIDSIALEKMTKESIVKYAKEVKGIDLNEKMTKKEMIKELI